MIFSINLSVALGSVRVLREADLSDFEKKSSTRRDSPCDQARALRDQCIALSLPEICHAGQNHIALLPLDISVVKKIFRHQYNDLSCATEREATEKDGKDRCKSDNEDNEILQI
ncbi:uncharacterized protein LOC111262280 [Varroa jacobsoni]|uniref:uncharacterized protein LOC111262280 n=1 Tax=Varroa jacobsoni TaxID=62625 RepID=UPI000BF643D0|nr:uncharacterized protein LOC111262280 [Varroa jacobsoni]